jgi:hypothetical protein
LMVSPIPGWAAASGIGAAARAAAMRTVNFMVSMDK